PAGRLKDIAEEAQLDAVLETGREEAEPIGFCCPVLAVDAEGARQPQAGKAVPISPPSLPPETTAYMMFTSGSTGKPKGVVISHQALATFLCAAVERLGLDDECHWLLITTIA
ncbi:AMP-binding protein, partial [Photobacterium sp. R1]